MTWGGILTSSQMVSVSEEVVVFVVGVNPVDPVVTFPLCLALGNQLLDGVIEDTVATLGEWDHGTLILVSQSERVYQAG